MVGIPFPLSSLPGFKPQDGQGRLRNVYAFKEAGKDRWRAVPGLSAFTDTAQSGPRGFLDVSGTIYAAYDGQAVTIASNGTVTTLSGGLSGTAPVSWARNNKTPTPDVVVVTEDGCFSVSSSAVTSFADADLPQPVSVAFLDGYFLWCIADGRVFASDLNSTSVNALSFTTAEASPDGLRRGVTKGRVFYAFGSTSIELFVNRGLSPFPLARTDVIAVGLIGRWAVAGFEEGWEHPMIFGAADNTVRLLDGTTPRRISFPFLERLIEAVADKSTLRASVYTFGGNAIWSLSCADWTWEYNIATGFWHERVSKGLDRWRAECSVLSRGTWYVGDTQSTNVLRVSELTRFEVADPLSSRVESAAMPAFPNRVAFPRSDWLFNVGVGNELGIDPTQTAPRVWISWSDDGGATFGTPIMREIGRQGKYETPVQINRTGSAGRYGRRWRVEWSDPVDMTFMGGDCQVQARA